MHKNKEDNKNKKELVKSDSIFSRWTSRGIAFRNADFRCRICSNVLINQLKNTLKS